MRILHVIDSLGIYGAETVLLNLATEQQRRGDRPVLLSISSPDVADKPIEIEARRRGIECVLLRMRGLNLAGGAEIMRIAHTRDVDVIHSHGYKSNILLGLLPRRSRRIPVVTTLHGWTAKSTWSKLGLYRMIDQRLLSRLDGVAVVNEQMLRLPALMRLRPAAQAIANGVSMPAASAPIPTDALAQKIAALRARNLTLLGVVGRLSPEKNVVGLVEALHILDNRNLGLVVLGAGPELPAIQRSIAEAELTDRVLLAGYVANARDYLALLDVLVIPSLTEGLPMILLEAMAAKLPVVSTRVGDIPAVLGELGVLVEPCDSRKLATAISATVDRLAEMRTLAAQAADRVATEYSATAMADRYSLLYTRVS
jgi:glycosyltransferase involved in cell wall biosynthesis